MLQDDQQVFTLRRCQALQIVIMMEDSFDSHDEKSHPDHLLLLGTKCKVGQTLHNLALRSSTASCVLKFPLLLVF